MERKIVTPPLQRPVIIRRNVEQEEPDFFDESQFIPTDALPKRLKPKFSEIQRQRRCKCPDCNPTMLNKEFVNPK
jgi:hypothetical protein